MRAGIGWLTLIAALIFAALNLLRATEIVRLEAELDGLAFAYFAGMIFAGIATALLWSTNPGLKRTLAVVGAMLVAVNLIGLLVLGATAFLGTFMHRADASSRVNIWIGVFFNLALAAFLGGVLARELLFDLGAFRKRAAQADVTKVADFRGKFQGLSTEAIKDLLDHYGSALVLEAEVALRQLLHERDQQRQGPHSELHA